MKGKIFILSGPSGSGKTTLYKKILSDKSLKSKIIRSVSVTTRAQRPGEKDGRDYFFVTKQKFLKMRAKGDFLESQKVFDNYYGTPKSWVLDALKQGQSVILCIDVKGAKVVWQKMRGAVRIFITTPTFEDLEKRLLARGSEQEAIVKLRLKTAKKELKEIKNYQHVVINDQLKKAYKQLKQTILGCLLK